MTNINININDINNFQSQTQQLPSHQLNTNLTSCNMPQNYVDITQDIYLESMKNSLDHQVNILNNLRIHQFTHLCVVINYALKN
jgi:uncharacterized Fe-S center protein